MKKILSLITSAVITCGVLFSSMPVNAQETAAAKTSTIDRDMTVNGTNSFGSMLSKEIQSVEGSTVECKSKVISAETEENNVIVTYYAEQNCSLIVGLYSEDGTKLYTSVSVEASADEKETIVTLDTEQMPKYYLIKAYLVETETLRPISVEYESSMYTQEMQDFFSKTIHDFDSERVLNLDEDETNNFVVFSESVIMLSEETNTLVSVDDVNYVYMFENPDEGTRPIIL